MRRRVTMVVEGTLTAGDLRRFMSTDPPIPGGDRPFDVVVDLRSARLDVATSQQAHSLAAFAEHAEPARRSGRIALIAPTDESFGIARMYAAYREKNAIAIQVFRRVEDADRWLESSAALE